MKPNFFILGAPKCGTTSLTLWLSRHPYAFLSDPKEPRYFNSDFDLPFRAKSISEYETLFDNSGNSLAVGEATTGYLCSNVAMNRILEYVPDARFVICLRPPVDLFISLHGQRMKEGFENLRSPEEAWNMQLDRLKGISVPVACPDPNLLHYERFCRLGMQLWQVLDQVPQDRIHVILLEDIINDPQAIYDRLCVFLGLSLYTLPEFSHENAAQVPRSLILAQSLRLAGKFRNLMRIPPLGFASRINKINLIRPKSKNISQAFLEMLEMHFKEDIQLLESCIARDLKHWHNSKRLNGGEHDIR